MINNYIIIKPVLYVYLLPKIIGIVLDAHHVVICVQMVPTKGNCDSFLFEIMLTFFQPHQLLLAICYKLKNCVIFMPTQWVNLKIGMNALLVYEC